MRHLIDRNTQWSPRSPEMPQVTWEEARCLQN
jgi:hypothetical protein